MMMSFSIDLNLEWRSPLLLAYSGGGEGEEAECLPVSELVAISAVLSWTVSIDKQMARGKGEVVLARKMKYLLSGITKLFAHGP